VFIVFIRTNARYTTFVLIYQTFAAILFNFLHGTEDYDKLFIFYIGGSGFIIFCMFYYISPFTKEAVSYIWAYGSALNLWTGIMLVFADVHIFFLIK